MSFDLQLSYPCELGYCPALSGEFALMDQRPLALRFTHPLPYGAIIHDGGVQFVVFSRSATSMRVLLYNRTGDADPGEVIDFDPDLNRWGDVWSIFVPGLGPGQLYHFQADGPHEPERGHRFDPQARLIDPYAKALAGRFLPAEGGVIRPPKCVVVDDEFDWQGDRHLRRPLSESVIYEMHVRGFTRARSSGVEHPGTYLGVIEKIPYLQELGVTAVELMPVHEFPIHDCLGQKLDRPNYWGYDPLSFFAPHRGYMVGNEPGDQVRQFKEMVRALHQAGIEVILDVVFNHTAEGNDQGPVLSLKGLENRVYYMLENGGRYYRNYTGCGNTLNGNHPIVRELIFHCLRHWVHNYHVDGFRFDLASIFSRDREGNIMPNPPVVEAISPKTRCWPTPRSSPRHGTRPGPTRWGRSHSLRWAEWNGRYRDDLRQFWRGDPHMIGPWPRGWPAPATSTRPAGGNPTTASTSSPRTTAFRSATWSATTRSTTRPTAKHNRDGDNNNYSYNYGAEGPTRRKGIEAVRRRQVKNMMATHAVGPGRADDSLGRRMPPHPTRQQQRLLPGQRHLVVQLEIGR